MIRDPLVRHAITPPAFDNRMVHRAKLVDSIHANIPRRLIAIAAPAGYGKTTLLADFAEHSDLPICWVRLSEAERDAARLVRILAASLVKRFRRLADRLDLSSLSSGPSESLAHTFTAAIDEHIDEAFVIALDDVHHLNGAEDALRFLDSFLETLPEQATLISAGREVLDVSLARFVGSGDLAGMGPQELALTQTELKELVDLRLGVQLTDFEAEQLMAETEGWITGVLLSKTISRQALGSLATAAQPLVYEYLASVVLNRLPDELRRFLLDSAVVSVMSAQVCDAVLGRSDSAEQLERLIRRGLFITAGADQPRTYFYHPKFREFLLESHEASDPAHLAQLRAAAGSYYAKHDSPDQAVDLFIAAGEYELAGETARHHVSEVYRAGQIQTLERWAETLEQAGIPVALLHLYAGLGHVDRSDFGAAKHSLERGQRLTESDPLTQVVTNILTAELAFSEERYEDTLAALDRVDDYADTGIEARYLAVSKKLRCRAIAMWKRDFDAAVVHMIEAVELLEGTGDDYALAAALTELAEFQQGVGRPLEGYRSSEKAVEMVRKIPTANWAIPLHNHALSAHLLGFYEEALRLWKEATKHARRGYRPGIEANICLSQGMLFNNLGMAQQATELYDRGLALAANTGYVLLQRWGFTQAAILHRRNGSDSVAMQWLKRAIRINRPERPPAFVQVQKAALEAKVRPDRGLAFLQSLLAGEGPPLDLQDRTNALYFRFKAVLEQGDGGEAERLLAELAEFAVSNGTLQWIASELVHDAAAHNYALEKVDDVPALEPVFERIGAMEAFVRLYAGDREARQAAPRPRAQALGKARIDLGRQHRLKPLPRELLFYLLDRGSSPRDVLLETFWPEIPPGRQVSNLHSAITSVRRALGKQAVVYDGVTYQLQLEDPIEFDVEHFERAATAADRLPIGDPRRKFALAEAIDSYGGPFLPEFVSNWVVERRIELELRYLDLLAEFSEEALVQDDPQRAVASLREALRIDPYREDVNRHYLEALGQLGRRAEIIRHYQEYSKLLAQELDLEPTEEIRSLYQQLIS